MFRTEAVKASQLVPDDHFIGKLPGEPTMVLWKVIRSVKGTEQTVVVTVECSHGGIRTSLPLSLLTGTEVYRVLLQPGPQIALEEFRRLAAEAGAV